MSRFLSFRVAAAAACTITLLAAGCGGGGGSGTGTSGGVLVGAGSTFVFPLVAKWIPDYSKKHGVTITYGPIGSGGGIEQVTNRTVDFGASDAPLSPDQQTACKGCLQIPWALGGTSIPYNVPGAPQHLKLTGEILASIYLGKVTSWDDPAIAKLNSGSKLPALHITPIYRSDSSGTTYNLTDYLSKVSPEWKAKVGTGTAVNFPTGVGGKGSSGVAAALSRAKGGITYVDAAYSIQSNFAYAALRNRAGSFELPNTAAVGAAAQSVQTIPSDNTISIVDPPASAAHAYPLSTFTYAIVPGKSGKADVLKPFLLYAVTDGQQFAPPLEFAKLPQTIVDVDKRTIDRITKG
ncbi:MAG: phosphate ABC transporter substrate-binding protein PstS [Gaiellaceae bacterium]